MCGLGSNKYIPNKPHVADQLRTDYANRTSDWFNLTSVQNFLLVGRWEILARSSVLWHIVQFCCSVTKRMLRSGHGQRKTAITRRRPKLLWFKANGGCIPCHPRPEQRMFATGAQRHIPSESRRYTWLTSVHMTGFLCHPAWVKSPFLA